MHKLKTLYRCPGRSQASTGFFGPKCFCPRHLQVCSCDADHRCTCDSSQLLVFTEAKVDQKNGDISATAGFLGAGKTTLVHHILNANHNHRIAVIVNEYGDTAGIESAAVTTGQARQADQLFCSIWLSPMALAFLHLPSSAVCTLAVHTRLMHEQFLHIKSKSVHTHPQSNPFVKMA